MKKTLLAVLGLILTVSANSKDYYVGKSVNNEIIENVDLDTIKKINISVLGSNNQDFITAVVKTSYQSNSDLRKKFGWYTSEDLYYISCSDHSYFIKEFRAFDRSNKQVDGRKNNASYLNIDKFDYAFPNTLTSAALDVACGHFYQKDNDYYEVEKGKTYTKEEAEKLFGGFTGRTIPPEEFLGNQIDNYAVEKNISQLVSAGRKKGLSDKRIYESIWQVPEHEIFLRWVKNQAAMLIGGEKIDDKFIASKFGLKL